MKTLKVFINFAEIIDENNKVTHRITKQNQEGLDLINALIESNEYNVINVNQEHDIYNLPEGFDPTNTLEQ
jgi:hypothetical protein